MPLTPAHELGKVLGKITQEQQSLAMNISPDNDESALDLRVSADMELVGEVVVTQNTYPSTSFILDHPVYGELDSSILELDGGYAETGIALYSQTF